MNTSPSGPRDLPHAAPGIPREAGQHELAREVGQHPGAGQGEDARPARGAPGGQSRTAAAMKTASPAAVAGTASGTSHQKPIRLEQDRLGDPVQAEQMVAEAEPPAASRRDCGTACAVEQGEQARNRNQQHRDGVHRRQRGGGQRTEAERGEIGAQAAQRRQARAGNGRSCVPATRTLACRQARAGRGFAPGPHPRALPSGLPPRAGGPWNPFKKGSAFGGGPGAKPPRELTLRAIARPLPAWQRKGRRWPEWTSGASDARPCT